MTQIVLGLGAVVGFATHASYHIATGNPQDALWVCHVATLLVGISLLRGSAEWNAAATEVLLVGLPIWVMDLVAGSDFLPTSLLTHVLGPAIGIAGAVKLGWPRRTWQRAWAFVAGTVVLTRLLTSSQANVNLAFAWPTYPVGFHVLPHTLELLATWAAMLAVADAVMRLAFRGVNLRVASRTQSQAPPSGH